jgi:dTDP-4-amino-4,6-dideoxygalactose transaminase
MAAGIGAGDEVIVPAHTFIASALGIVHAGATPVFCDVEDEHGLIDIASVSAVVGPRTAAILPVHLYGQPCDLTELGLFAQQKGLAIIEDAAQAHGAKWGDAMAGSIGTASAFSFYPSKNLGAFGDGGVICTSDSRIAERARQLRNLGQLNKGEHAIGGHNERLDTIQAAVLAVKLPHLEDWNESRREAAAAYRKALPVSVKLLPRRDRCVDVHHLFPVRVHDRDRVRSLLADRGIGTGVHYSPAIHRQPPLQAFAPRAPLPMAERWAAETLSLPMFAGITPAEVRSVCDALAEVVEDIGIGDGVDAQGAPIARERESQ